MSGARRGVVAVEGGVLAEEHCWSVESAGRREAQRHRTASAVSGLRVLRRASANCKVDPGGEKDSSAFQGLPLAASRVGRRRWMTRIPGRRGSTEEMGVCARVWVRVQEPAGGFLGIQRFRAHLAKQRTRVRSLVQEDPTHQGATRAPALHAERGREQKIKKQKTKRNLFLPHCASGYISALRSDHGSEAATMLLIDEDAEAPKSNFLRVLEQTSGRIAANSDPRAHFYPLSRVEVKVGLWSLP